MEIIKMDEKLYPEKLKGIKNPPEKLYALGNLELLNTNCITIVGSRKCSEYGINMAKKFAEELSSKGVTIVSGLANRNRYCGTRGNDEYYR